jgi:hypothetical protein
MSGPEPPIKQGVPSVRGAANPFFTCHSCFKEERKDQDRDNSASEYQMDQLRIQVANATVVKYYVRSEVKARYLFIQSFLSSSKDTV